jgi:hypothetical protein
MDKFLVGCFVGMLMFAATLKNVDGLVTQASDAKKECEKSLPRDQHCVIVALPVSKD